MTGIRPRRSLIVGVAVVLVLALAALGTAYVTVLRPRQARDDNAQTVRRGVTVVLPQGAQAKAYQPSAAEATPRAKRLLNRQALKPMAGPYDFQSIRPVPAGTQIRFQLAKGLKGPVFAAYFDQKASRWVPEPASYDPTTGIATATVEHFSDHGIFGWAMERIKALLQGAFEEFYGSLIARGEQPQCGPWNGIIREVSSSAKSILSCHEATVVERPSADNPGVANIVLRLNNNRHYPVDVVYSSQGSAAVNEPGSSLGARLGAVITKAVKHEPGREHLLLPAGATATITFTGAQVPFEGLEVYTQLDGLAFLTGILQTGFEELVALVGLWGTSWADKPIYTPEFLYTSERAGELFEGLSASKQLETVYRELQDPSLSPEDMKALGELAFNLLGDVFEQSVVFKLLAITSVAAHLIDELFGQALFGLYDMARGQTFHRFAFKAEGPTWATPQRFARFAGEWGNPDRYLKITPDGTGEIRYAAFGACPGADDPTTPCDPSQPTYRQVKAGEVRFRIDRVVSQDGNAAHAVTTYSSEPEEWGGGMTIIPVRRGSRVAGVTIVPSPGSITDNEWFFCAENADGADVCME